MPKQVRGRTDARVVMHDQRQRRSAVQAGDVFMSLRLRHGLGSAKREVVEELAQQVELQPV